VFCVPLVGLGVEQATSFRIPESDNSEEDIDNVPVCDKNKSDKFSTLGKRK
jgi:hypothetical protein